MNRRLFILCLCLFAALLSAPEARANDSTASGGVPWRLTLFGHRAEPIQYDRRMIHASEIALKRAYPKPTWRCWHFVKDALLAARVIDERPTSPWAKQAGDELCRRFGFRKLPLTDPRDAPVGAVIVYGGADAGHVELRTHSGYVSDFISNTPYPRPLIGVYVKEA